MRTLLLFKYPVFKSRLLKYLFQFDFNNLKTRLKNLQDVVANSEPADVQIKLAEPDETEKKTYTIKL